jgi:hypothetical protein
MINNASTRLRSPSSAAGLVHGLLTEHLMLMRNVLNRYLSTLDKRYSLENAVVIVTKPFFWSRRMDRLSATSRVRLTRRRPHSSLSLSTCFLGMNIGLRDKGLTDAGTHSTSYSYVPGDQFQIGCFFLLSPFFNSCVLDVCVQSEAESLFKNAGRNTDQNLSSSWKRKVGV